MKQKLRVSIDRAVSLLGSRLDYGNYVCLKIRPENGGCCCFHCWPFTWQEVNKAIAPFGPIQDEGDVLIKTDDGSFVLECHESGPEIIVYLGGATAGVLLIKAIVELITTIVKSRSGEPQRRHGRLIIAKRTFKGSRVKEETALEIDLPSGPSDAAALVVKLNAVFKDEKKPSESVQRIAEKKDSP